MGRAQRNPSSLTETGVPVVRLATVLPLTSELCDWHLFRITVEPSQRTGLRTRSQVMVDKAATVSRSRVGQRIGRLDPETIVAVSDALAKFLGLGWFEMPQSR